MNLMNIFFANIGNNLASAIPKSKVSFESFLYKSPLNSFVLFLATEIEIENIIKYLFRQGVPLSSCARNCFRRVS